MKYLIDTHILLWVTNDDPRLTNKVKRIILNEENEIYVSIAGLWEIAIKASLKKLILYEPLKEFVRTKVIGNKIKIAGISAEHLYLLENLPFHHRDPFDRLLISQSLADNIPIISKNSIFREYKIKLIW